VAFGRKGIHTNNGEKEAFRRMLGLNIELRRLSMKQLAVMYLAENCMQLAREGDGGIERGGR